MESIGVIIAIVIAVVIVLIAIEDNKLAYTRLDLEKAQKRLNKFKAILVIQVIIDIILILLGAYIMFLDNNKSCVDYYPYSEMEISAYNSRLEEYKGIQRGSWVEDIIDRLVANARSHIEDKWLLPEIKYFENNNEVIKIVLEEGSDGVNEYINQLKKLKKEIQRDDEYEVSFDYDEVGFINVVKIKYQI